MPTRSGAQQAQRTNSPSFKNGRRHEHAARQEASARQSTPGALFANDTHTILAKPFNGSTTRSSLAPNAAATILSHPPYALRGHLVFLEQRQHQRQHAAYGALQLREQCSPVDLLSQHFHNQPDVVRRSHAEAKSYCLVRPCSARRPQDTRRTEASEDARHHGSGRIAQWRRADQHKQLRACGWHEEQDQTSRRGQGQRVQCRCQLFRSRRSDALECYRG